jgi:UDP-N-acetylglucosamine 3-dehydrogenase
MRDLSIAVIGVGRMGAFHVETLERMSDAVLVAVADPNELSARRCIGRRPIAWFEDYRDLLARTDLDAVTICTPSSAHAEIALAAIAAGKHVFIEKPIATTLGDGLQIALAAQQAQIKLMVGHIERFNPAIAGMADLVGGGQIGRVFRAHAVRVGPLPTRVIDSGVTLDLATHDLDIMQFVLGRPITSVYAEGRRFQHPSEEDLVTCLLRFGEPGPVGLLDVNWLTPEKRRELTVIGERGMLSASYLTQDLWFTESTGEPMDWSEIARVRGHTEARALRFAVPRVEPLKAELEAFVHCVLDDAEEPVSAHDGCRALAAALAVLESANEARRAELPELLAVSAGEPVSRERARRLRQR